MLARTKLICKMWSFHLILYNFKCKITRISRVSFLLYSWLKFTSNEILSHWLCHSILFGTVPVSLAPSLCIYYEKKHFISGASRKLNHNMMLSHNQQSTSVLTISVDLTQNCFLSDPEPTQYHVLGLVPVLFSHLLLLNDGTSLLFLTLAFLKSGELLFCRSSLVLPLFLILLLTHLHDVFSHLFYLHHIEMPMTWNLR